MRRKYNNEAKIIYAPFSVLFPFAGATAANTEHHLVFQPGKAGRPCGEIGDREESALHRRDYATAQRLFEACDRKDVVAAIEEALQALDHKDYATALRLFEALGQKGLAASKVRESGPVIPAPPEPAALGVGPVSASDSEAQLPARAQVTPFVDVVLRLDLPPKGKKRGLGRPLIGVGLALCMACGAVAILRSPPDWRFAVEEMIGDLASAISAHKAPAAIAFQRGAEGQPSAMNDHDALLPTAVAPSGASTLQVSGYGSTAAQLYRKALVNPDRWWSERRKVAGELLDLNEPRLAFELCDNAVRPGDPANQVDANFFAGWIALRFLNDARAAAPRFERAAEVAQTPISIARAAYWRGRAAEALGDLENAKVYYQTAASEPIAYYGPGASSSATGWAAHS
jgi:tetratricopeptide (TPR) repeat protein